MTDLADATGGSTTLDLAVEPDSDDGAGGDPTSERDDRDGPIIESHGAAQARGRAILDSPI